MDGILIFYLGVNDISAALFDVDGNCIDTCTRGISLNIDEDNVEQDPQQWYDAVVDIIKEMSTKHQEVIINTISMTYAAGTFVCIDKLGHNVMDAIMPFDGRARYQAVVCEKTVPDKYRDEPAIPYSYMILPALMWIKHNRPDIYKSIYMVLTPDAYIAYRLCGECAVDRYTALLLGYSLRTNKYNIRLLNRLGLEKSILPDVKRPGESIGIIGGTMKEKLCLKSDVKFLLASNGLVSLAACKGNNENILFYDMESSSFCLLNKRLKSCRGVMKIALKEENKYIYAFNGNNEMQFIKHIDSNIKSNDIKDEKYKPGSRGLVVVPFVYPDIGASILGMGYDTDKSDIIYALYESIGYFIKGRIDYLSDHGIGVESIDISSPIKDMFLYQIVADITNKKIEVNHEVSGILSGAQKLAAGISSTKNEEVLSVQPQAERTSVYRQYMGLYRNAYSSVNEIYRYKRRLNRKYGE